MRKKSMLTWPYQHVGLKRKTLRGRYLNVMEVNQRCRRLAHPTPMENNAKLARYFISYISVHP